MCNEHYGFVFPFCIIMMMCVDVIMRIEQTRFGSQQLELRSLSPQLENTPARGVVPFLELVIRKSTIVVQVTVKKSLLSSDLPQFIRADADRVLRAFVRLKQDFEHGCEVSRHFNQGNEAIVIRIKERNAARIFSSR